MTHPQPRSADLVDPTRFRVVWRDGAVTEYGARALRLACPCARCVDENSGSPLLDPASVPEDVALLGAELVGRYGLSFRWSDGHGTGIFTWPRLRSLADSEPGS
ncbi:MAG: hypothetical protein Fur0037_25930 [Planctomycetota bacterium]